MKRWPVSDTGVPTFVPTVCTDGVPAKHNEDPENGVLDLAHSTMTRHKGKLLKAFLVRS